MKNSFDIIIVEDRHDLDLYSKRSQLYGLEPMEKGTAYVECLTSYISRLAHAHNISLTNLMLGTIYPCIMETSKRNSFKTEEGKYINGIGKVAQRYVNILEELTNKSDLNQLTLMNWSAILNKSTLINGYKRWCPICFSGWELKGSIVYEPLIWNLKGVKICNIHNLYLQEECPCCKKRIPYFTTYIRLGYCPYCNSNLGNMEYYQYYNFKHIHESDKNIVGTYLDLIKSGSFLTIVPLKEKINYFFTRLLNENKDVSFTNFSKQLNYDRKRMTTWFYGIHIPPIEFWTKMCTILEVSIDTLFLNDIDLKAISPYLQKKKRSKTYKKFEKQDKDKMEHILVLYLDNFDKTRNIMSFSQVADLYGFHHSILSKQFPDLKKLIDEKYREFLKKKKLQEIRNLEKRIGDIIEDESMYKWGIKTALKKFGISYKVARRHFPDLCQKIINNHLEYVKQKSKERIEREKRNIKDFMIHLHNEGIIPTDTTVVNYYPKSVVFKEHFFRRYRTEVRKELGYDF
ncbi:MULTISPECIES: TniQ family protein [Bacillus cereus group]|nr:MULTISPECIES: TniQ family protein [Bacillus cereus group]MDA1606710.1 TniQ family protein [Bacillus cereus group sp. TH208-1LC]MDA1689814.1 TniQ family protein [Bacillus cereus group sp. TH147LC]